MADFWMLNRKRRNEIRTSDLSAGGLVLISHSHNLRNLGNWLMVTNPYFSDGQLVLLPHFSTHLASVTTSSNHLA